jgi:hypothetical protein
MSQSCTSVGTIDMSAWREQISDPQIDLLFEDYNFHYVQQVKAKKIIYLLWVSNKTVLQNKIVLYKFEKELSTFNELLNNTISTLSTLYPDCIPVKAMIVKLEPNVSTQSNRLETIDVINKSNRIIIPIVSNDMVYHMIDDEKHQVSTDNMYNIKIIGKTHRIVNSGTTPYVQLVIDMLPCSCVNDNIQEVIINKNNVDEFKL